MPFCQRNTPELLARLRKEARLAPHRERDSSRAEEGSRLKDFLLKNKLEMALWVPCTRLQCHIPTHRGRLSFSDALMWLWGEFKPLARLTLAPA